MPEEEVSKKIEKIPKEMKERADIKKEKSSFRPEKEGRFEVGKEISEGSKGKERATEAMTISPLSPVLQRSKKAREKEIEKVLEKDLESFYLEMSVDKQQQFKKEGEVVTQKISEMLEKGKAKAGKIIDLIKKWLSIIPGVNKFFIEQEAKIKTDEILKIK